MKKFLSKKVGEFFSNKGNGKGMFGVEIELEGNVQGLIADFPKELAETWIEETDGSLKEAGSKEFVFRKPLNKAEAITAVTTLYDKLKSSGRKPLDSMRAGVHVHLNCADLTLKQLFTFLACYYCLEDLIVETFGEDRVGNLFCLRVTDADFTNEMILRFLESRGQKAFGREDYRYAAMNLVSLYKFGSLETRALKSPATSPEKIIDWIEALETLLNFSKEFKNPIDVLSFFSESADKNLIEKFLGPKFAKEITSQQPDYEQTLFNSIRRMQFWVFTTNWDQEE